jgi:hypothetical protein
MGSKHGPCPTAQRGKKLGVATENRLVCRGLMAEAVRVPLNNRELGAGENLA